MVVIAFAQVFFIAGTGTEYCNRVSNIAEEMESNSKLPWQCKATSSYFQSFGMLLNVSFEFLDWNVEDQDEDDFFYLRIISYLFGLVVGILLLNILIAVVNNVFTKVSEESEDAFWTTRMDFMVEVNMIRNSFFKLQGGAKDEADATYGKELDLVDGGVVRKHFAEYDDDWMKNTCSKDDLEDFYKVYRVQLKNE